MLKVENGPSRGSVNVRFSILWNQKASENGHSAKSLPSGRFVEKDLYGQNAAEKTQKDLKT